jgi:hypothetical protein
MKGLLGIPKMKNPTATPAVSRDDVSSASAINDELTKRRGGAADILNGVSGAEAGATGKTVLG